MKKQWFPRLLKREEMNGRITERERVRRAAEKRKRWYPRIATRDELTEMIISELSYLRRIIGAD